MHFSGLASLTQHHYFELCPWIMYPQFILLYLWAELHCAEATPAFFWVVLAWCICFFPSASNLCIFPLYLFIAGFEQRDYDKPQFNFFS